MPIGTWLITFTLSTIVLALFLFVSTEVLILYIGLVQELFGWFGHVLYLRLYELNELSTHHKVKIKIKTISISTIM